MIASTSLPPGAADGSSWDGAENRTNHQTPSTSDLLWIYTAPCILITGICGNTLVLLVMSQGRMRGTSTSVYLLTMAVVDLLAIVTGVVPDWLTALDVVTIKEVHPFLCQTEKFLFYTSADTSVWACVAFTVDRFVAVCFPMDSARLCPPLNAKYYAVAVSLAAVCKNLHVFVTRGHQLVSRNNGTEMATICGSPNDDYAHFEKYVRPWIAFTVVNVIPFVVIVFCNLFIVRAMVRLRRSHRQSVIVSSKDSSTTIQMTVLSLSASVCFLVCVTPSMILLIGKPYWSEEPSYELAKAVGNLIFYVNHSINFFLYCITGGKFRAELRALISRTASAGQRSSICRDSNYVTFATKLQKDRLSQLNGSPSGPCASASRVSSAVDEKPVLRGSADRTFSGVKSRDPQRASNDAMLLKASGVDGKQSHV